MFYLTRHLLSYLAGLDPGSELLTSGQASEAVKGRLQRQERRERPEAATHPMPTSVLRPLGLRPALPRPPWDLSSLLRHPVLGMAAPTKPRAQSTHHALPLSSEPNIPHISYHMTGNITPAT